MLKIILICVIISKIRVASKPEPGYQSNRPLAFVTFVAPAVRPAAPALVPHARPTAPTATPALVLPDDADRRRQRKEKSWALAWNLWPRLLLQLRRAGALMRRTKEAASGYDICCKCTIQMFQIF